jgi:hypothetical protein
MNYPDHSVCGPGCTCPVCKPNLNRAAGQCSALTTGNTPGSANTGAHGSAVGIMEKGTRGYFEKGGAVWGHYHYDSGGSSSSEMRGRPDAAREEPFAAKNRTLDSTGLKQRIDHTYEEPGDLNAATNVGSWQEIWSSSRISNKHKVPMKKMVPHRHLEDNEVWNCSAGGGQASPVSKKVDKPGDNSVGNIVPALRQDPDDPPLTAFSELVASTDVGTVLKWHRKARGGYSEEFSDFTNKLNVRNNGLLRYGNWDKRMVRSTSTPPDVSRCSWNPLTHFGDAQVSLETLANDVTNRIKSEENSTNPADHHKCDCKLAGLSSATFADRKFRQMRGGVDRSKMDNFSPRLSGWQFQSQVAEATGHGGSQRAHSEERNRRLNDEPLFSAVCEATIQAKNDNISKVAAIHQKIGNVNSSQVGAALQWEK